MRPRTKNKLAMGAFSRGRDAHRIGLPVVACPYPGNAIYKEFWEKGWTYERHRDQRASAKFRKEVERLKGSK